MIPYNYQMSRFTDWIRSFLESQKSELEKNNQYAYMKQKYDIVVKGLKNLDEVEAKWNAVHVKEREEYEVAVEKDPTIKDDFLAYQNEDVIKYFPPQLIIGRCLSEEVKEVIDTDPHVTISIV